MEKKFYEQPLIEVMDVEEEESILLATSDEAGYGGPADPEWEE